VPLHPEPRRARSCLFSGNGGAACERRSRSGQNEGNDAASWAGAGPRGLMRFRENVRALQRRLYSFLSRRPTVNLSSSALSIRGEGDSNLGVPVIDPEATVPARELSVAFDQQAATQEILRIITRSPHDVQPVLE